jgi:hypothetical protein
VIQKNELYFCNQGSNVIQNQLSKSKHRLKSFVLQACVIKTLVNVIYIPLTKIFNKCIAENVFPNVLKISKVIPLFKKGDKDNMNNYTPISIVPTFSKVFEYLLKKQITKFFDNNNLFSKSQYGFRNNLSTTLAVNDLSEFVFSALENKEHVNATCFDLSKAFDCVTHHILYY